VEIFLLSPSLIMPHTTHNPTPKLEDCLLSFFCGCFTIYWQQAGDVPCCGDRNPPDMETHVNYLQIAASSVEEADCYITRPKTAISDIWSTENSSPTRPSVSGCHLRMSLIPQSECNSEVPPILHLWYLAE
jgi:hypothetical protein